MGDEQEDVDAEDGADAVKQEIDEEEEEEEYKVVRHGDGRDERNADETERVVAAGVDTMTEKGVGHFEGVSDASQRDGDNDNDEDGTKLDWEGEGKAVDMEDGVRGWRGGSTC